MITIDLPKDKAQALHAEIEAAGGRVEIVDEKRLFGDAATVTVVFEGAKSLIELVSVSLIPRRAEADSRRGFPGG